MSGTTATSVPYDTILAAGNLGLDTLNSEIAERKKVIISDYIVEQSMDTGAWFWKKPGRILTTAEAEDEIENMEPFDEVGNRTPKHEFNKIEKEFEEYKGRIEALVELADFVKLQHENFNEGDGLVTLCLEDFKLLQAEFNEVLHEWITDKASCRE